MLRDDVWECFRGYIDKGSVTVIANHLESEGVPTRIERGPMSGHMPEFWIIVQCSMVHRARWILAQLQPEDSELNYLATKKLGDDTE